MTDDIKYDVFFSDAPAAPPAAPRGPACLADAEAAGIAAYAALLGVIARVERTAGFSSFAAPFGLLAPEGGDYVPVYGGEIGLTEDAAFRVVRAFALERLTERRRSLYTALTGPFGVAPPRLSAAVEALAAARAAGLAPHA
ncbi:MAG: hypothetical protein K2Q06_02955, partial [Parvularculaceae bacterium]|nr:hypothetical protein [Parvularculaceae bacterium]